MANSQEMSVREEKVFTVAEGELEEFALLVLRQDEIAESLLKMKVGLSKPANDRRTVQWNNKISDKLCALQSECATRHAQLQKYEEFAGSEYEEEGVHDLVVETCSTITNWLEKEVARGGSECKMRTFNLDLVTGYLAEYQIQSEEDLCGLDYRFIMDRIEKAMEHASAILPQKLEVECSALATRIQKYSVSIKPVASSSNGTGAGNGSPPPNQTTTASSVQPLTLETVGSALTAAHTPKSDLRLPRIELLRFDGDLDKWRDFKVRFVGLVHSEKTLDPINKMHFLKTSLAGDALDTVKNMSLRQYEKACEVVLNRYQNQKILAYNTMPSASKRSSNVKKWFSDSLKVIRYDLSDWKVDKWNVMFVFIISERLPKDTFEEWEQPCESTTSIQSFDSRENRVHTLQSMEKSYGKVKIQAAVGQVPMKAVAGSSKSTPTRKSMGHNQPVPCENPVLKCKLCSGNYRNYKCPKFTELAPIELKKIVEKNQLSIVCLNEHLVEFCKTQWRCRKCNGKHNSQLHVVSSQLCNSDGNVFLASALVNIESDSGRQRRIRVLIDQGSMRNFVTESVAQSMRLPRQHSYTVVVGIGGAQTESIGIAQFSFSSIVDPKLKFRVNAEILPVVARDLNELSAELPVEFTELVLADKLFWKGGAVDAIFGAAVYSDILLSGMKKHTMLAQETHLGWILSGRTGIAGSRSAFRETEEKTVPVPACTQGQQ